MQQGFTLTELLTVVAILGIIFAIGIPQYQGYQASAELTLAQNNLRAIHMKQQEYMLDHNLYYATGVTCANATAAINTTLFEGKTILPNSTSGYTYCITQGATSDFTATATNSSTAATLTITDNNITNF